MSLLNKIRCALSNRRIRWEIAVSAGLFAAVLLSDFAGFAFACRTVRTDTLRLHILANSDTEEDQALKLAVRDEILRTAGNVFSASATKQQAMECAQKQLPEIRSAAQRTVREKGYDYPVSVKLENLYFDTREYDGFTLPAGRYDAVRVEIGAHEGHNWFCVLFPPMCVPAASGKGGLCGYSKQQQDAVTNRCEIKFAAAELFSYLKESMSKDAFCEKNAVFTEKNDESTQADSISGKGRHKAD